MPLKLWAAPLAIDLGTANTRVWARNGKAPIREASAVAYARNGRPVAVGREAWELAQRQAEGVRVVRPIRRGQVAEFAPAVAMLRQFVRRALERRPVFSPQAVVAVPAEISEVGRRAVRDALRAAGVSRVFAIPKSLAACLGSGLPAEAPDSRLVIDMGAGITEVGVVSMGMLTAARSIPLGGADLDEAIRKFLWRNLGLALSQAEAEQIKLHVASVDPAQAGNSLDLSSLLPPGRTTSIESADIAGVLAEALEPLADEIAWTIEQLGAKQRQEVQANGAVLCGGTALLRGLADLLSSRLALRVFVAEDPLSATILGLGAVASELAAAPAAARQLERIALPGFQP